MNKHDIEKVLALTEQIITKGSPVRFIHNPEYLRRIELTTFQLMNEVAKHSEDIYLYGHEVI